MSDMATFTKLFTMEEANGMLARIGPDVERLVQTFAEIRAEIDEAAGQARLPVGSPDLAGHLEARGIAPRLFDRVKSIIERIHAHGCLVNGPEAGLIDFPCLYNNEIVFLCWKFGEDRVGHWHRIPEGFAGRKPLLDLSEIDPGAFVH